MANEMHCTGPVSTLPGTRRTPEPGAVCDDHEDRPAVAKIQGDTDSFGAEWFYVCQECLDAFLEEMRGEKPEAEKSACDWCSRIDHLSPIRNSGEGMCGPVYYVCKACSSAQAKRDQEEYNELFPCQPDDDDFE